jgi:glycosyltransferase involved in cell wall biosynthesis
MSPAVLMPADIRFPLERANGVQIVKTAAALADLGIATELLVRHSDPRATAAVLSLYGVPAATTLRVTRVGVGHRRGRTLLPRLRFLWQALRRARQHLKAGGVVYTRDLQLAAALVRWRQPGKGALVYEAHAVEALMYQERAALYGSKERVSAAKLRRLQRREHAVWRGADAFVATTGGIAAAFAEAYGQRRRVAVIPNGADLSAHAAPPPLVAEPPHRVLYAGQLYPWKGVDVLVEAMAFVPDATLVVIGGLEGEPDLDRVRALVAARGLAARTELRPTIPQTEVQAELLRASVIAVPFRRTAMSERHTSPLKAFEAMAAGRPLVTSDLPSSREFLEHEKNALLVPPDDPQALGEAIRRLIEHPLLARRLARAAFDAAPAFAWPARARKIQFLLRGLEPGADR